MSAKSLLNPDLVSSPGRKKPMKEGKDYGWVESYNRTFKIIFRNPDDSIAEILEPLSPKNKNVTSQM